MGAPANCTKFEGALDGHWLHEDGRVVTDRGLTVAPSLAVYRSARAAGAGLVEEGQFKSLGTLIDLGIANSDAAIRVAPTHMLGGVAIAFPAEMTKQIANSGDDGGVWFIRPEIARPLLDAMNAIVEGAA